MFKTGHSLIKNHMKEMKAILAGEMSGHIFFAEDYFGYDDAIHAALQIATILAEKMPDNKMSDFLADLPPVVVTPEIRIDCDEELKFKLVARVVELVEEHATLKKSPEIQSLNRIDGVRIEFGQGWGLVRASNTQPILVSRYEASDQAALNSYRSFVEGIIERARETI